MNYEQIYNQLIEKRKLNPITEGYRENHHILPKSLGGKDEKSNIVTLTGREHWVAHLLLHKIHRRRETSHAIWMMQCKSKTNKGRYDIKNSRMYEWARIQCIKSWSKNGKKRIGKKNGSYGTMWICNIEFKENKKISKDEEIPEGWIKGRSKWNRKDKDEINLNARKNYKKRKYKKGCKYCGEKVCKNKAICSRFPYVKDAFIRLGFDDSQNFYSEYNRIINLLRQEYQDNKMSMNDIAIKYNLNSHQRVRNLLKIFDIDRRNLSEAYKN